jgi:hypothetical protein
MQAVASLQWRQLAAVKALAAQAGPGPEAHQFLGASGAVPKLLQHRITFITYITRHTR